MRHYISFFILFPLCFSYCCTIRLPKAVRGLISIQFIDLLWPFPTSGLSFSKVTKTDLSEPGFLCSNEANCFCLVSSEWERQYTNHQALDKHASLQVSQFWIPEGSALLVLTAVILRTSCYQLVTRNLRLLWVCHILGACNALTVLRSSQMVSFSPKELRGTDFSHKVKRGRRAEEEVSSSCEHTDETLDISKVSVRTLWLRI